MKYNIHPQEQFYFRFMAIVSLFIYALLLIKMPVVTIVAYIAAIAVLRKIGSLLFIGYIKGNAIKVTEKQFSDVYRVLENHCKALEMTEVPHMYLLQGNGILNAFATRVSGRNFVVIHSDIFELAYQEGMDAVSFIIGHELGHIKRNHLDFKKSLLIFPARMLPFLGNAYSRACEYTCDNIGYSLCPQGVSQGILILAAGKKLYKKVNCNELINNFDKEPKFAINFAEMFSTHPLLIKRVKNIDQLNSENPATQDPYISPKVDFTRSEIQQ